MSGLYFLDYPEATLIPFLSCCASLLFPLPFFPESMFTGDLDCRMERERTFRAMGTSRAEIQLSDQMECIHIPANEQRERTCPTLGGRGVITCSLEQEEGSYHFPANLYLNWVEEGE